MSRLAAPLKSVIEVAEQIAVLLGALPNEDDRRRALTIAGELIPRDSAELLERFRRNGRDAMVETPPTVAAE
jgi:hypothetical protein